MSKTKISWTDYSWSPVTGCTHSGSKGCDFCFAKTMAKRFWGDRKFSDIRCHPERLEQPLHWKNSRRIFVCSTADLFHPEIPFEFIDRVMVTIARCPQHCFQLLTKRPKRMAEYFATIDIRTLTIDHRPFDNVHIGVSISTNDELWKVEKLRQIPAAVKFLSAEPLLTSLPDLDLDGISQVIVGCESINGRPGRECKIEWVRDVVQQCKAAGVKTFVKQLHIDGKLVRDIKDFPADLRIQETI